MNIHKGFRTLSPPIPLTPFSLYKKHSVHKFTTRDSSPTSNFREPRTFRTFRVIKVKLPYLNHPVDESGLWIPPKLDYTHAPMVFKNKN
ncbi:hypothetical protein CEXT_231471 [Caerostris extrusa]|uniref:Uncharacterized protein n=1 Tax=Caerostris extrusa TaxID=172846 RepID=A0AAV4R9G7_CAEEX|nr:hypothetical protein CEXT_231471 [Caerostris extrusa]